MLGSQACALRATLHPTVLQVVLGYGRQTTCPGPLPAPLLPVALTPPPAPPLLPAPLEPLDATCITLEVGPKSYADVISALGAAALAFAGIF